MSGVNAMVFRHFMNDFEKPDSGLIKLWTARFFKAILEI